MYAILHFFCLNKGITNKVVTATRLSYLSISSILLQKCTFQFCHKIVHVTLLSTASLLLVRLVIATEMSIENGGKIENNCPDMKANKQYGMPQGRVAS